MIREPDTAAAATAGPFLLTEGIHNLRDYGGYAVAGGARVKTGLLWRSGQHMEASEDDLALLARLDIRTIIDARPFPVAVIPNSTRM